MKLARSSILSPVYSIRNQRDCPCTVKYVSSLPCSCARHTWPITLPSISLWAMGSSFGPAYGRTLESTLRRAVGARCELLHSGVGRDREAWGGQPQRPLEWG